MENGNQKKEVQLELIEIHYLKELEKQLLNQL